MQGRQVDIDFYCFVFFSRLISVTILIRILFFFSDYVSGYVWIMLVEKFENARTYNWKE